MLRSAGLRTLLFWCRASQQQGHAAVQHVPSSWFTQQQCNDSTQECRSSLSTGTCSSGLQSPRCIATACRSGVGSVLHQPSDVNPAHSSASSTAIGLAASAWWQAGQIRHFEASKPVIPANKRVPPRKKPDNSAYVNVILLKDVPYLGKRGAVKLASPGWVRNYLFPQGQVVYATPENRELYKLKEGEKVEAENTEEFQQRKFAQLLDALTRAEVYITRRGAHDKGQPEKVMSRHVSAKDIVKTAAMQLGIGLEPEHLFMDKPIDTAGKYKVPLNLQTTAGQQIELTVIVNTIPHIHHKTRYYS